MKAVRHHPRTPPCCFPLPLYTPSGYSTRLVQQTKPGQVSPPSVAPLGFLLVEVQGLALFNLSNNRQGSPAGGLTDIPAGCLKDVKGRFGIWGSCVCGRLPVDTSI